MWDKHYQSVELLLPFDKNTDGGPVDFSSYRRTPSVFDISIDASNAAHNYHASSHFNGLNDSNWWGIEFGKPIIPATADFTVEAWIYPESAPFEPRYICSQRRSAVTESGRLAFNLRDERQLQLFVGHQNGSFFLDGQTAVPLDQWSHVALTREGGTFRLWLNGVLEAEAYSEYQIDQNSFFIGRYAYSLMERQWVGNMQDFRVTRIARYYEPFTPPERMTAPIMQAMIEDDAQYLKAGNIGVLSGNVTTTAGAPADKVILLAQEGYQVGEAEPDQNGDWSAEVMAAPHFIGYFGDGCQPTLHGPYMPEVP